MTQSLRESRHQPPGRALCAWLVSAVLLGCAAGSPDPAVPGRAGDEPERDVYRRAVGGLGAGYLFQTHMAIGTTADLLGRRAYEPAEVDAMMKTTIGMGKSVDEMLRGLRQVELGPGDQDTLSQMREINRMLGDQATALQAFARDRNESNARRFAELRSSTWTRLEKLLSIQPPPSSGEGS